MVTDGMVERDKAGKWLKPPRGGRRPGPSRADRIAAYLEPDLTAVLDKLRGLALLGDPKSLALYLSYLAPVAKADSERVSLPALATARTLEEKCQVVIAAVGDGAISAEAGERLLRLIQTYATAVKTDELEARLAAVEQGKVLVRPTHVVDNETGA